MAKYFLPKILGLFFVLLTFILFDGCAATRKIDAASILSKTKVEIGSVKLDSVNINPDLFPQKGKGGLLSGLLPNPQVVTMVQNFARGIIEKELGTASLSVELTALNQSSDTLWVRSFTADMDLDSVVTLPLVLKDSCMLIPGRNNLSVATQLPIDARLFKLPSVRRFKVTGILEVALDSAGVSVPFNFSEEKNITNEEMKTIEEKAKTSILNGLVSDWVGAILPKE